MLTETADFAQILHQYDGALARVQTSHDALLHRVSELQSELQRKNDLLAHQQRLAVLGELAAGMAHEIRNPLGAIRLYLDLMERQGEQSRAGTIQKIRAVIARLDRVVRDVLSHSREVQLALRPTALSQLVMDAVNLAALESGDAVSLRVEADDTSANLDADLVVRALLNLVLNSIQAVRDQTAPGVVTVRAHGQDGRARITVEDNGPGIPPDQLPQLFTPFFTNKQAGTGLGLSTARRVAEAHGGSLSACNLPAGGARFTLELPL